MQGSEGESEVYSVMIWKVEKGSIDVYSWDSSTKDQV